MLTLGTLRVIRDHSEPAGDEGRFAGVVFGSFTRDSLAGGQIHLASRCSGFGTAGRRGAGPDHHQGLQVCDLRTGGTR